MAMDSPPTLAFIADLSRSCQGWAGTESLQRTPTLSRGFRRCPTPNGPILADGGDVKSAFGCPVSSRIHRENNFLALKRASADDTADRNPALLIGFQRDRVGNPPSRNLSDTQAARDARDQVLLLTMVAFFDILYPGARHRLHAEADTGCNGGIIGHLRGQRRATDASSNR